MSQILYGHEPLPWSKVSIFGYSRYHLVGAKAELKLMSSLYVAFKKMVL